jgi:glycosyltransferase involved in cell wall biosynthesis
VHVLVDLERSLEAGGHVKCWERFARVATGVRGLDLTVHFLGETASVEELSPAVRIISHVPSCSSRKLGLEGMPAATDLALSHRNRRLEEYLEGSDVLHTTDAFFAMARTALRVARRTGIPLVTSVHTDVPRYARIFAAAACRQTPFGAPLGHVLVRWLRVPDICGWIMDRRFRRYILECDWILHARPEELQVMDGLPSRRVSVLRRGVDSRFFHPHQGDRSRLSEVFGVPPGSFTVLHAGRIDDSKSVMTLVYAVRRLLDEGVPVHLLMVGQGPRTKAIGELLGSAVTLAGVVDQSTLSWIYASSDVLAFPSRTEVFPNVVLESKASGLPVLVSADGGSARLVAQDGTDGLTLPDDPAAWARAIDELRLDPDRLQAIRQRARRSIVDGWPTWEEVLMEDLLPVWRELGKKEAVAAPAGAQAQPAFRFVDGA